MTSEPLLDRPLVGTVVSSPDPVLGERVASAFDFVWLDMEHSALGIGDVQLLAIAARAGGAVPFVRVPRFDSELVGAALDTGAAGIVAPRIAGAEDARALANATSYPPAGTRGFAPRRGAHDRRAPERAITCVVQIETRGALDEVREIAAVDGIDALVVGTADLALELDGALGLESGGLADAVARVREAALGEGKAWGVAASDVPDWLTTALEPGAMLVHSSDFAIYAAAIDRAADNLRGATWGTPA